MNQDEAERVENHWYDVLEEKCKERFYVSAYKPYVIFSTNNNGDHNVIIMEDYTRTRRIKVAPKYAQNGKSSEA